MFFLNNEKKAYKTCVACNTRNVRIIKNVPPKISEAEKY